MTTSLDDPERLAALERSGLLRKQPPDRLRHIVYTAYVLLRADAAQMNVHTDRVQVTAFEWPPAEPRVMPLEDSGCRLVVLPEQVVAIPDTTEHSVTCSLPWVRAFRGYLGMVVCFDSQPIGSLCVFTVEPRDWQDCDCMTIVALADLAESAAAG